MAPRSSRAGGDGCSVSGRRVEATALRPSSSGGTLARDATFGASGGRASGRRVSAFELAMGLAGVVGGACGVSSRTSRSSVSRGSAGAVTGSIGPVAASRRPPGRVMRQPPGTGSTRRSSRNGRQTTQTSVGNHSRSTIRRGDGSAWSASPQVKASSRSPATGSVKRRWACPTFTTSPFSRTRIGGGAGAGGDVSKRSRHSLPPPATATGSGRVSVSWTRVARSSRSIRRSRARPRRSWARAARSASTRPDARSNSSRSRRPRFSAARPVGELQRKRRPRPASAVSQRSAGPSSIRAAVRGRSLARDSVACPRASAPDSGAGAADPEDAASSRRRPFWADACAGGAGFPRCSRGASAEDLPPASAPSATCSAGFVSFDVVAS